MRFPGRFYGGKMTRTMLSILKVLDRHRETIIGSRELSRQLKLHGVDIAERTVRYHMRILDERGFTRVFGKEGRQITRRGREELANFRLTLTWGKTQAR
jgi:repressor of nif and glnA expression